jgi:HEPN domain-containing protein
MTNEEFSQGLFRQAKSRLRTMHEAYENGDYPYVVRTARSLVSMIIKSQEQTPSPVTP